MEAMSSNLHHKTPPILDIISSKAQFADASILQHMIRQARHNCLPSAPKFKILQIAVRYFEIPSQSQYCCPFHSSQQIRTQITEWVT